MTTLTNTFVVLIRFKSVCIAIPRVTFIEQGDHGASGLHSCLRACMALCIEGVCVERIRPT